MMGHPDVWRTTGHKMIRSQQCFAGSMLAGSRLRTGVSSFRFGGLRVRPSICTSVTVSGKKGHSGIDKAKDRRETEDLSDSRSGIVFTSDAPSTSIDDLLEKIDPVAVFQVPSTTLPASLLLLLTPRYAPNALDEHLPTAILDRLLGEDSQVVPLQSVTAVVDRLPTPQRTKEGREGIAYLLQSGSSSPFWRNAKPFQASTQKPGCLNFEIAMNRPGPSPNIQTWRLQLPLAQTVFSTGWVSTLVHRHHDVDASLTTAARKLITQRHLESQDLRLPENDHDDCMTVSTSLIPLTPLRKIQNSMGNIIRVLSSATGEQLFAAGSQSEPGSERVQSGIPASQELEAAVSSYFQTLDLSPEPVSVWGLIIPESVRWTNIEGLEFTQDVLRGLDDEAIRSIWKPSTPANARTRRNFESALVSYLKNKCRLVKILSGGGGWGKKAGLLSLDPDSEYMTRDIRTDRGWDFGFGTSDRRTDASIEEEMGEALGHTAKEGDSIMFFLAPRLTATETWPGNLRIAKVSAVELGTIASSVNATTESEQDRSPDGKQAEIVHCRNCFGMLSEGGMALTVVEDGNKVNQTKLDVPMLRCLR